MIIERFIGPVRSWTSTVWWEAGRQPSRNEAFNIAVRNGEAVRRSLPSVWKSGWDPTYTIGGWRHDHSSYVVFRADQQLRQWRVSDQYESTRWRRRRTVRCAIADELHLVVKESTEVVCSVSRRRWSTLVVVTPEQLRQRLPQITAAGMLLRYQLRWWWWWWWWWW